MFEKASRLKLRFKVANGMLSTEDLWDLKLEALDVLAKALRKEVADSSEESFIKAKTKTNEATELKFEIVKYVISVKLAEEEARKNLAARRAKRDQLLSLINQKENDNLASKSIDELRKELEALDV